jgi:hypothetical protein
MAVLEKETNQYYKINFDNCSVKGLTVFVNFSAYLDTGEREKEKERIEKWAKFFRRLREILQEKQNGLFAAIEATGLTPEQVVSATEENKIDGARYPDLRELQERWNALEPYEKWLGDSLYRFGEAELPCIEMSDGIAAQLAELGFESEWITDPVRITAGAEVNVGDYKGEPISHEFYYERLKSVMGETVDV